MLLKKLSEANGVSGDESIIRNMIRSELELSVDEVRVDTLGNLIVRKSGKAESPKIALVAHMDEIGLMITKITTDGLLKFTLVGNYDHRLLVSKVVTIGDSSVKGVIGAKPIHLQKKAEREKSLSPEQLYIDIGVGSKEEASKLVSIGDYVSMDSPYKEFRGGNIKGKSLDSRASCSIVTEILKSELDYSIYGVFTTMKQVGIYGGGPALDGLDVDYAIIVDGIDSELGKGAVINIKEIRTRFDQELSKGILSEASIKGIQTQIVGMEHDNSDATRSQLVAGGSRVIRLGFPCKYKKTSVNLINKKDMDNTKRLLALAIDRIGGF